MLSSRASFSIPKWVLDAGDQVLLPTLPVSKSIFAGTVLAVQPRIRLHRSFDQRHHSYQGYVLRIDGQVDGWNRQVVLAIGEAAQEKNAFRSGDQITGEGEFVLNPKAEIADLYKAARLSVVSRNNIELPLGPPWLGEAPALETYRARGHRRLDTKTFNNKCVTCVWACEMAVEITIDQWDASNVRWRRETFCYGPKSCKLHRPGPTRKVPGRKGMSWEEEDWIEEDETSHRGEDE